MRYIFKKSKKSYKAKKNIYSMNIKSKFGKHNKEQRNKVNWENTFIDKKKYI